MALRTATPWMLIGLVATGCKPPPPATPGDASTGCTEEARVCPDGSTVVRSGPDCDFERCPADADNGLSPDPSATAEGDAPEPMGTFDPDGPPG